MLNKIKMALGTSLMDSLIQGHPLECSICLERMREVSHLITPPDKYGSVCDHYFCTKCIEPIVESAKQKGKDPQCPTCRRVAVGVTRSRLANDMIQEIEKEREERKLVIQQKEDLQRLLSKTEEEYKQEIDDLREQLDEQRDIIREGMEEEMSKIKDDQKLLIKKLKKQNKKYMVTIDTLKQDLLTKEAEKQDLLELLEQHRVMIDDLKNKNSDEEVVDELRNELSQLQIKENVEKEELKELIQQQQILIKQLQDEKELIEQEKEKLDNSYLVHKSQVKEMEKQITSIPSLELKVKELTSISQDLMLQLTQEREKFENEKLKIQSQLTSSSNSTIEDLTMQLSTQKQMTSQIVSKLNELKSNTSRDLSLLQEQLHIKSEESDKWQRMYLQLREDKNREMSKDQKVDNSYLSSWLSPINKLSNPLSYIKWAPTRMGRLVRSANEIKFIERRGSNLYGSVWKGIEKGIVSNGERSIALKRINTQLNTLDAYRECFLLDRLDHKHIVKVESVVRDVMYPGSDTPGDFMILPFYSFDLEFLMSDTSKRLSRQIIRYIMYQLLSAIYYLHSAEIIHRDIKPTSILLDENFHVTLAGFTYARSLLSLPHQKVPISRYSAPENLYDAKIDKSSDIWSLGVIFAELLLGSSLFERNLLLSQILSIKELRPSLSYYNKYPSLNNSSASSSSKSIHDILSSSTSSSIEQVEIELLLGMLSFEPDKRMNCIQCLQSRYFVEGNLKDVHKTCGYANELTDEEIPRFVNTHCGGL